MEAALRLRHIQCKNLQKASKVYIKTFPQPTLGVQAELTGVIDGCQLVCADFGINVPTAQADEFREKMEIALKKPKSRKNSSVKLYRQLKPVLDAYYIAFQTERDRLAAIAGVH